MKSTQGKITLSEYQIQTQIMNYLRYKGYYCMRLNSGKYSVGEGRSKQFIMGQDAWTPDIMAFKPFLHDGSKRIIEQVWLYFIEVKRPGGHPTPLQLAKMKELEEYGSRCLVIDSIEKLQEASL